MFARCSANARARGFSVSGRDRHFGRIDRWLGRRRRRRNYQGGGGGGGGRIGSRFSFRDPTSNSFRCTDATGRQDPDDQRRRGRRLQLRADPAGTAGHGRSHPRGRPGRQHRFSSQQPPRTLIGGEEISEFKDGDDQIIVRLRLDEAYRNNPATMGDLLDPGRTRPDRQGERRRHHAQRAWTG